MSDLPGGSTDRMPDDVDELELVDSSELDEGRKRALIAKLPDKEGSQLKKDEIQLIIRTEKLVGRNFLFAVSRTGSSSSRYLRLYYNVRGDQESAKATAPCKYIRCSDCAELLYFEGSHLSRHEALHKRVGNDRKRPATPQITDFIPHPLSVAEKSAVADVLASYAIEGNVSFRSITQPAFNRAAIALINIGAKRRKPVEEKPDQLVNRMTVARRVSHIAEESYDKIKGILDILRESGGALAADYGKRLDDYLCVTAHFIQAGASGWQLRCVPVGFSVCSESKTSEQVWLDMIDALDSFGMSEDDIAKCIGVSDEGANISGSLRDHMDSAVLCACHVFSTIANRTFDLYAYVKDGHLLTAQEEKLVAKALDVLTLARLIANEVRSVPKVSRKRGGAD
ncbi:hypothetical protein AAVH_40255 [Aphelenchoides avenae]|nr:hypothetical protein AAVH_40255 [Aphelenchus avenae]